MYRIISHSSKISPFPEDIYRAVKQVSQYVIGTSYTEIGDDYQYVNYAGETMILQLDHHRLVKTPGFEILLTDIDDLQFEIINDLVYVIITRDENDYRFLLTYAKEKEEIKEENEEVIE
ncbi:hypothetical protein [Longibaculum muris]|uniref:hypothetical protein n=1 Tax=Longibaculum muris TaxID=1796628 RepID=UPI003AB7265A